jgi:hypothetical protein
VITIYIVYYINSLLIKMKKLIVYTTVGTMLVISTVFVSNKVFAEDLSPSQDTFIDKLASKLGLSDDEVVEVVTDVREEVQAEREAQRVEAITEAMDSGVLTEKQAEILDAMEDIRGSSGKPDNWEEWHSYTPEQREALRNDRRELREQDMLDALNDQGLSVTEQELDDLHEIMLEEGISMYGRRGEKGIGMGNMMMQGSSYHR